MDGSEADDFHKSFGNPIPDEAESLREVVDRRMAGAGAPARAPEEPPSDPRDKKVWWFDFAWVDARGKVWTGRFKSKIRTTAERLRSSTMFSALIGGFPLESIKPIDRLLANAVAFMEYSLDRKESPDWAKNMLGIEDPNLVLALWKEAASHEAVYFRTGEGPVAGPAGAPGPMEQPGGVVDAEAPPPRDAPLVPRRRPG